MSLHDLETHKSSHEYFHALCVHPSTKFANQHHNEEVLVVIRAHPITLLPVFGFAIVLAIVPMFINILLADFFTFFQILFINIVVYSSIFSYVFINFVLWVHNVGIITNHRIIDIDYTSVLLKSATGSSLDDIADVNGKTTGFIRSIFNFGDVHVQTAGIEQNIVFIDAPEPDTIVSLVSRIIRDHRSSSFRPRDGE